MNNCRRYARLEVSELRVNVAKTHSELAFAKDRMTMLQQTSDMERKELAELRKRNADYLDAILKQQSQIQATMSDVMQAREKEQKALLQVTALSSELVATKNSEKRLSTDNESLGEEKSRLSRLLANLQAMLSDRETTEVEARQRLAQQLDVSNGNCKPQGGAWQRLGMHTRLSSLLLNEKSGI